jgi:diguanylate cyclase (GGDEF)-like protein
MRTLKPKSHSEIDHRKAVLSLRWLLAILASYLTLFSYAGTPLFPLALGVVLVFSTANIVFMVMPRRWFVGDDFQRIVAILDVVFISTILYLLRVPENYLYVAFVAVVILAAFWRDIRLALLPLIFVGIVFGILTYLRPPGFERFLSLSLFFAVSIFYVFLTERLMKDGKIAASMTEENRLAEVMVEMTRAVSSSLNTDDVLYSIVSRLRQVLGAKECSIFRIDPKTGTVRMMKASRREERNITVNLDEYPELKQAHESQRLLYMPDAKPMSVIAIPMVVNEVVLGLIDVRSAKLGPVLTEANTRFFEIMASTAASALRNAQLFEEVEQRARTDYLTALANHRFFQATLSVELGRAQRHNRTLSLLMIDLDFLKSVNDRFGHPSGDMVIRTIAEIIRMSCREIDFPARYGGEEFTVILPDTSLSGAVQVAERIRETIAAHQFPGIGNVTASIGVSNYPVNALSKADLIRVADQALYTAKNAGRDRVAHFDVQMMAK